MIYLQYCCKQVYTTTLLELIIRPFTLGTHWDDHSPNSYPNRHHASRSLRGAFVEPLGSLRGAFTNQFINNRDPLGATVWCKSFTTEPPRRHHSCLPEPSPIRQVIKNPTISGETLSTPSSKTFEHFIVRK